MFWAIMGRTRGFWEVMTNARLHAVTAVPGDVHLQ